ncbi:hypothetical protein [Rothia nasimurium]|nr:hypothetical protein [Rothia nasimurium]
MTGEPLDLMVSGSAVCEGRVEVSEDGLYLVAVETSRIFGDYQSGSTGI